MLFMAARSGGLSSWGSIYGPVKGRPEIGVARLTEEIGILALSDPGNEVSIGDRLEVLPNHISLAGNLHEAMHGVRNGAVEREIPIA